MATAAQIRANQQNAAKSTGPRTPEGKEISRANSLKHGLTGAGIVLPQSDAAEVERRVVVFVEELRAEGEVEQSLARRAAAVLQALQQLGVAARAHLGEAEFALGAQGHPAAQLLGHGPVSYTHLTLPTNREV